MGVLLYLRLDPKNSSLNLPQTLPDLHGRTHAHTILPAHTHTHTHTHTLPITVALLCYAEVAFVGWAEYLCPLWQALTVPAAACCLSPGHGLPAGPPTNLPEPLPSSWRHPGWSRFMRLWQGPAQITPPPTPFPPPLLSGSFGSRKQPRCVPNVELHWESVNVASYIFIIREDVDVLYFWGFWRSEKWKKNVCRQGCLYLVCIWICVYIFACFFLGKSATGSWHRLKGSKYVFVFQSR